MPQGAVWSFRIEGAIVSTFKPVIQVSHWEQVNPDNGDIYVNASELATIFMNRYIQRVVPLITSAWQLVACHAQVVAPARSVPARVVPSQVVLGGIAGASCPSDVAVVASMRTNQPGRSGIGRNFYGPIAESNTTNDVIPAGHAQAWVTALGLLFGDQMVSGTNGIAVRSGVFSAKRFRDNTPPHFFALRNIEIDSVLRTMRKRGDLVRIPFAS